MRIGIDVDETVLSLYNEWKQYTEERGLELDLSNEVTCPITLSFWKNDKLYDDKEPFPEAAHYINELHKNHEIIFISHCFEEHVQSKIKFLDKYFKYDKFIDTEHKYLEDIDVLIDDRERFFKPVIDNKLNIICILYKNNWKEIYNQIKEMNV